MKRIALNLVVAGALVFFLASIFPNVHGQATYGSLSIGPIAPTVANCPAPAAGSATYCPVGSATAGYTTYVSYNAGTYQLLVPAGTAVTGAAPIVVSGSTISCPTCVTGSVVTSFGNPGRTGAVVLTKADVNATAPVVTTTVTSTATSSVQ